MRPGSMLRVRSRRDFFRSRPILEQLEDRTIPSVTPVLSPLPGYDPTQILVRYRDGSPELVPLPPLPGSPMPTTNLGGGLLAVPVLPGMDVAATLTAYRANPNVLYAEPNYLLQTQVTPNDPQFSALWGLNNTGQTNGTPDADIDAVEAWESNTGSLDVTVGIIDTGIDYRHPDLYLNIWINQDEIPTAIRNALVDTDSDGRITFYDLNAAANDGKVNDANGNEYIDADDLLANTSGWEDNTDNDNNGRRDDLVGWDFVSNDNDPLDDNEHGTHVAGTIGAIGNNGIGVAGVNWKVQMAGLKFLDQFGSGSLEAALEAINYAVREGFDLTNNSWGGGGFSQSLYDAIDSANEAGQLFVAAAGNSSSNSDDFPAYPASYDLPNIISVAATDHQDGLAGFSNIGKRTVDLGAPGVDILSTTPNGTYSGFSGTSMATPHVAGVVALVIAEHPDWSVSQITTHLYANIDPISSLTGRTATGGRLNAANVVGPDRNGARVSARTPAATSGPISSLRLTFNEEIQPGSFTVEDVVRLTGPDSAPINVTGVSVVTGSGNRRFDVAFASQSALGVYTIVVGPDILDVAGNAMNQDGDGSNGESSDRYTGTFSIATERVFENNTPVPIIGLLSTVSTITIDEDISIARVRIEVDITHPNAGELDISVVSPRYLIFPGTRVMLSSDNGGTGDDYDRTLFDDAAAQSIVDGTAPFTGTFRPEEPLSTYIGKNARGTWELVVDHWLSFSEGTLNSWRLYIQAGEGDEPPGDPPPDDPPPDDPPPDDPPPDDPPPDDPPPDDPPPDDPPPQINNPPIAMNDFFEISEDSTATLDVLANDFDPDGDILTVIDVTGVVGGTANINADSTITFTPNANYFGTAGFTYTISDGKGGQANTVVQLFVKPINDAPVAVDDQASGITDTPLVFDGMFGHPPRLTANDTDIDSGNLQVVGVGNAENGSVVINFDGSVTFTPDAGYIGSASFEYTVSDGELTDTGRVDLAIAGLYFLTTSTSGTVIGSNGNALAFSDADILLLDVEGEDNFTFSLHFDGSDVGLTTGNEDIDAFALLPDGSILISTTGSFSVPGPNGTTISGTGSDLLKFFPTSLGEGTAGTWSFYFEGRDVGLTTTGENIDAVALLPDGRLLISTTSAVSVPRVNAADTDLLVFTPSSLGRFTSGTWTVYFDGSDVALTDYTGEDIDGLYVKPATTPGGLPTLYFSTVGSFAVPGVSGTNHDLIAFTPTRLGSFTTGAYNSDLTLHGGLVGLGAFNIDGMHIGLAPTSFGTVAQSSRTASLRVSTSRYGIGLGNVPQGESPDATLVTGLSPKAIDQYFAATPEQRIASQKPTRATVEQTEEAAPSTTEEGLTNLQRRRGRRR